MTILVATDKFKGSISAPKAVQAIVTGLLKKYPNATIISNPMADGGEGSLDIIQKYLSGETITVSTKNALGDPLMAEYFLCDKTAYIELAAASGLEKIKTSQRNPLYTTTYGTGLILKNALDRGAEKIVLMLGGSSTNDAGLGIAAALDYKFYDSKNELITTEGKNLVAIEKIVAPNNLQTFELDILCDVKNPMYGPTGAAYVYAKQKGADESAVELLDAGLINIASKIEEFFGKSIGDIPGGGAAGGIAAGLHGMLNGQIKNGFKTFAELTNISEKVKQADLIISGEGKLDNQSLNGKVVGEIANICTKYSKKHVVLVGKNELTPSVIQHNNIHSVLEIVSLVDTEDAFKNAAKHLTSLAQLI